MTTIDPQRLGQYEQITPRTYAMGGALLLMGAFGIYMMLAWSRVYPLLTVFFYSIPANAAMSLFPHEPMLVWYGRFVNLLKLSLVATLGTMLALYIDYKFFATLLNLRYSEKYKSRRIYIRARELFNRYPFWVVAAGSLSPLPFYPFKFMVYSTKYPLRNFLGAVAVGRFPRYYLLGLAGHLLQVPNWIIFVIFFSMSVAVLYNRIFIVISRRFVSLYRIFVPRSPSSGPPAALPGRESASMADSKTSERAPDPAFSHRQEQEESFIGRGRPGRKP